MEIRFLSSRQNPSVKAIASLSDKRERDRAGLFLCEGFTIISEALLAGICPESVVMKKGADPEKKEKITSLAEKAGMDLVYEAEDFVFEKLTSEKGSDGFVSVFRKADLPEKISGEKFVALERVQDPGNVGTVVRSALAFGAGAVFLVGCADPFSQKAVKASMGAVFSMPIKDFPSSAEMFSYFAKNGIRSIAAVLHTESKDIRDTDLSGKVCAVIGNEGSGLSGEAIALADEKSVIPISSAESLNAAVASSVFLWEMKRRK